MNPLLDQCLVVLFILGALTWFYLRFRSKKGGCSSGCVCSDTSKKRWRG